MRRTTPYPLSPIPYPLSPKESIMHTILPLFLSAAKRSPLLSAALVIAILLSMGLSVLPPWVLGLVIDGMTAGTIDERGLLLLGGAYFLLTVLSNGSASLQSALITIFGERATHRIRFAMAEKLSRLPASYFDGHDSGRMASLFVNDVDTLEILFSSGVISMISDALQIFAMLFAIYFLSPGLLLLLLIALPLLFLLTRAFQTRMRQSQLAYRRALADASSLIPETIRHRVTLFFLGAAPFMKRRYHVAAKKSFAAMSRSNFYDSIYSPIVITASACLIALLVVLSGASDLFGVTAGSAAALFAYLHRIFSPLESMGMEIQNIQSAIAGITRISDFLNEKEMAHPQSPTAHKENAISLRNMTFGYTKDHLIFENFSLALPEGSRTTFVGRTGAGKSTLFKLLLGLTAPLEGEISIFGRNPTAVSAGERRRLFGVVEQTFVPVLGTVRDQITLGDPRITDDDVHRALTLVGLSDAFPQGLSAPYSAALLSHGEEQLLSIARAIAADPAILLLDEITASLDAETEKRILSALSSASESRTVLAISHRVAKESAGQVVEIA